MTWQIFLKLSRISETAVAGARTQYKICKFQFTALTCTKWSKMAKIPKISGTSGGQNSRKIWYVNAVGQNSELTGLNLCYEIRFQKYLMFSHPFG